MPVKRVKTKKTMKKQKMKQSSSMNQPHKLIDLIAMISQASANRTKSKSNLPARLMKMNTPRSSMMLRMQKPTSYSKSVSSSYSSVMHNGHIHKQGKQVINNSTNPFIQINEMQNGQVAQYIIPKSTISQPSSLSFQLSTMAKPKKSKKAMKSMKVKKVKKSKKSKKVKNSNK